jgi:hypothetical protein
MSEQNENKNKNKNKNKRYREPESLDDDDDDDNDNKRQKNDLDDRIMANFDIKNNTTNITISHTDRLIKTHIDVLRNISTMWRKALEVDNKNIVITIDPAIAKTFTIEQLIEFISMGYGQFHKQSLLPDPNNISCTDLIGIYNCAVWAGSNDAIPFLQNSIEQLIEVRQLTSDDSVKLMEMAYSTNTFPKAILRKHKSVIHISIVNGDTDISKFTDKMMKALYMYARSDSKLVRKSYNDLAKKHNLLQHNIARHISTITELKSSN